MNALRYVRDALRRAGYLARAAAWATVLGIIELVTSKRGRRLLAAGALGGVAIGFVVSDPITSIAPGDVGIRVNRLTGGVSELSEGWAWSLPGIHRVRQYPLRDQVYRPSKSATARGEAPFQSLEGLSIGVDVVVRFAFDPTQIRSLSVALPTNAVDALVEPVADGVLHRTFSKHTVRQIFSSERAAIENQITTELTEALADDGILVREVFIGNVDLPEEYKQGLEALLAEELESDKMQYTLELKRKKITQSELEARADKARREQAAQAAGQETIIAAKARAEAMKHILPLKEKEIEQGRLEAEASKVRRIRLAQGNAQARRIEASGEADSRRTLADAEGYRLDVVNKKATEQLARDSVLIANNPLLIQKTVADKLSDNIKVIIAPPGAGGFFANGLLGQPGGNAP